MNEERSLVVGPDVLRSWADAMEQKDRNAPSIARLRANADSWERDKNRISVLEFYGQGVIDIFVTVGYGALLEKAIAALGEALAGIEG